MKNVREAFEVCELVRINCQGIKGSDYKKIGGKLKVCKIFSVSYVFVLESVFFFFIPASRKANSLTSGSRPMHADII